MIHKILFPALSLLLSFSLLAQDEFQAEDDGYIYYPDTDEIRGEESQAQLQEEREETETEQPSYWDRSMEQARSPSQNKMNVECVCPAPPPENQEETSIFPAGSTVNVLPGPVEIKNGQPQQEVQEPTNYTNDTYQQINPPEVKTVQ